MKGSNKAYHRGRIAILCFLLCGSMIGLVGGLFFLMTFRSEHHNRIAEDLYKRECIIKAVRGNIMDVNGTVIATNRTVCTISVIHNQVKDLGIVTRVLVNELGVLKEEVRKKVEKRSSREIIKTNVDKEEGDKTRSYAMEGVKVDEDYKQYYPYDSLASKVPGFTGGDNQGITGPEVMYEKYLKGINGTTLAMTDVAGIEIENTFEDWMESVAGNNLYTSLDANIQKYAEQATYQVMEKKGAKRVSVIATDPQSGEVMVMVNVSEFNLNDPPMLNMESEGSLTAREKQDLLNQVWRNPCISNTYEPGSTFKIIMVVVGLEDGMAGLKDHFSYPDLRIVEDREIRYHKVGGYGSETFLQGVMNSCNPVFIDVGQRLGVEHFHHYFEQLDLLGKTGVDLSGEAATIMYKKENMGLVELVTVSPGQLFQVTPLQLITTASPIINGGNRVTSYSGVKAASADGEAVRGSEYPVRADVVPAETSETMRYTLEYVVAEGSGKKAALGGYRIDGKTTTNEKPPRSLKEYISSFIGFAPANDPQVIALITIDEPVGIYYGDTIAALVVSGTFKSILSYLGIEAIKEEIASATRIYG